MGIPVYTQVLEGKWIEEVHPSGITIPMTAIYEINEAELQIFSFDKPHHVESLKINYKEKLWASNNNVRDLIFVNDFKIKLSLTDQYHNHAGYAGLVKLLPTLINYPIEKVRKSMYENFEKQWTFGKAPDIIFDVFLGDSERIKRLGTKGSNKFMLEQLDNTFFISIYIGDMRFRSIPIKEINPDYLVVYGVFGIDEMIRINKLK